MKGVEYMDVKQLCEIKINKMINEVVTQEHMEDYLSMMTKFPQMGMENILLLLSQLPEATVVCGKGAWEKYGATVKEGKKPIALLGIVQSVAEYEDEEDDIDDEELVVDFGTVAVYDISQVNISDKTPKFATKNELKQPVLDLLRQKYGIVVFENVPKSNFTSGIKKSMYRPTEKTLYLREGISDIQKEKEFLKNYIAIALDYRNVSDFQPEMEHYLTIAVCKYFNLPCDDNTVRASELFSVSSEEKRLFLRTLAENFFFIVNELTGKEVLNFNETSLCNILFISQNKDDVFAAIGGITEMAGNIAIRNITMTFMSRVLSFKEEVYTEIKKRRDMQLLFTFPPTILSEQ